MRKNNLIILLFFLLVSCSENRPDILLINIDDMGWLDTGFMGSQYYETPVLDGLASEGIIFTRAYAAASNCAPSRACMMSGQWATRHGIYTVGNSDRGKSSTRKLIPTENTQHLPDEYYILAEALHDAGYKTCHAGKWHLNQDPTTQGFDLNIGGCEAGNPGSYYPPYRNVPLKAPDSTYYLTNLIMDLTIDFVKSVDKNESFFLYYSPYAVHTPIQPVKDLVPKYLNKKSWNGQDNARYASMVENLDTQVGRLLEALEQKGRLKNTFILFISDNGGVYNITKQWPLRAGKGSYYEGGIREPMFVVWPDRLIGLKKTEMPVSNLDIYPTLLDVAGIQKPEDLLLDGNSLLSFLEEGKELEERPLFWHFPVYLEGGNKETQDPLFRTRPGSAISYGDWKLIEYFENGDLELYNLRDDISEKINLADSLPGKLEEMKKMLYDWRLKTSAPVPIEHNPEFITIEKE
ncbi:MAG: sulfatase [Marinilabiliaceae bacterium]|jgi:arylsulfatase A-like enzyme|nr:sulfatase [Marinilabiliaceae bacterium]